MVAAVRLVHDTYVAGDYVASSMPYVPMKGRANRTHSAPGEQALALAPLETEGADGSTSARFNTTLLLLSSRSLANSTVCLEPRSLARSVMISKRLELNGVLRAPVSVGVVVVWDHGLG